MLCTHNSYLSGLKFQSKNTTITQGFWATTFKNDGHEMDNDKGNNDGHELA